MFVLQGDVKLRPEASLGDVEAALCRIPLRDTSEVRPVPGTGLVTVRVALSDPSLSWESARTRVWAHVQALVEDPTPIATVGAL